MTRRRRTAAALSVPLEHVEQCHLFQWFAIMAGQQPQYRLFYAIPNGGDRHHAVGGKLRAEGVKAGFPDVAAPIARGGYFGIAVEMKRKKGSKFDDEQKWWRDQLIAQGYYWRLCKGAQVAYEVIGEYMSWAPTAVELPRKKSKIEFIKWEVEAA